MDATLPPATTSHTLSKHQLRPAFGVSRAEADGIWAITESQARFHCDTPFSPGWYEVRIRLRSETDFSIRKRLDLTLENHSASPPIVSRECFAWNRSLIESFVLPITEPIDSLRVDLWDAQGAITVEEFEFRRFSRSAMLTRAIRDKVRLTRSYRCFGPALARGGRLLLTGRFRTFGNKLIKGLTDTRIMQFGGTDELDAAWWRRQMITVAEAEEARQMVESRKGWPAVAVVIPVDPDRLDQAHGAIASVRRQIYPDVRLYLLAAGPSGLRPHLEAIVGLDKRSRIVQVPLAGGLSAAFTKALRLIRAEQVLIAPCGLELAEHAVLQLVKQTIGTTNPEPVASTPAADDAEQRTLGLFPIEAVRRLLPDQLTPGSVHHWITTLSEQTGAKRIERPLAFPANQRALLVKPTIVGERRRLVLSGDLYGLSGYGHVVYALMKGLPTAGAELQLHPGCMIVKDLLPPGLVPPVGRHIPGDPQLIVNLPKLDSRFPVDGNSAVVTMWETDFIPADWVQRMNRAKVILVPSRWGADCFRQCGVTVPIEVAPLGYDPLVFHPIPDAVRSPVCTFGTAGALSAGGLRKNAQRVIDAFRMAFPNERDVRLRVKITPNSPALETYDDHRVEVVRAILTTGELAEWYRSLTAYVNASAGEGFGLHLIEAMACGRPIISAEYSGLTEFFDAGVGYPIDYRLVPVKNKIYAGNWAEPDPASMIQQMRAVYADRDEAARLGAASATRAKRFTWKAGGRIYVNLLRKYGFLGE